MIYNLRNKSMRRKKEKRPRGEARGDAGQGGQSITNRVGKRQKHARNSSEFTKQ